jgi:hypothetical protein
MCELLSMAFEGMHPTFRQVPPRAPRFSTQAVYAKTSLASRPWGRGLVKVEEATQAQSLFVIASSMHEERWCIKM